MNLHTDADRTEAGLLIVLSCDDTLEDNKVGTVETSVILSSSSSSSLSSSSSDSSSERSTESALGLKILAL